MLIFGVFFTKYDDFLIFLHEGPFLTREGLRNNQFTYIGLMLSNTCEVFLFHEFSEILEIKIP